MSAMTRAARGGHGQGSREPGRTKVALANTKREMALEAITALLALEQAPVVRVEDWNRQKDATLAACVRWHEAEAHAGRLK